MHKKPDHFLTSAPGHDPNGCSARTSYKKNKIYPLRRKLIKCITMLLICLSVTKSFIKPIKAIDIPKIAPTEKLNNINIKLISVRTARMSFHSKRYFSLILKNFFIFSITNSPSLLLLHSITK